MKFITVVGLEIHCELMTATKIFCGCKNSFESTPNINVCPLCTGAPGTLPVLNKRVIELAIKAGLSFGCEISRLTTWERKHYFYPDLAKAYQISQLVRPLCIAGGVPINRIVANDSTRSNKSDDASGRVNDNIQCNQNSSQKVNIRLNRIHVEEDAGKLIHSGRSTIMDDNRSSVPLIEIVTEPDIRSADEAVEFVEKVRRTLVYAGVSDGKMEQGSIRVDANISVMAEGAKEYGTRVEIKNINSFKFLKKAIEHEAERHIELVLDGKGHEIVQETRGFDEQSGETFSMRRKEDATDYRYFLDPDIPPLKLADEDIESIAKTLPETPISRFDRYIACGISTTDADIILENKVISDFFDECLSAALKSDITAQEIVNPIKGEIFRRFNQSQRQDKVDMEAKDLVDAIALVKKGEMSSNGLKAAIKGCFEGKTLTQVVAQENLIIKEDKDLLKSVVKNVIEANPKAVSQYKGGDQKVIGFLIGQCARELKGAAQPTAIRAELEAQMGKG